MRQNHTARRAPRHPRAASSAPPNKSRNSGVKKTDKSCACELIIRKSKSNDAYAIQQSGQFADVLIRSVDNVINAGHKWVLVSLSPQLLTPLGNPPMSSAGAARSLPVVESDLSSQVLTEVLRLAYTGACQLTEDLIIPLLQAADAYHMTPLLKLCGDYMLDTVAAAAATTTSPQSADITVRNFRLAQQHLCQHVVEGLARLIRRNFPDHIRPGGAAFLFRPQELALLLAKTDLPLRETDIIDFILAAAAVGQWDTKDTGFLLQYVRFTLLTRGELEQLMADDRMATFITGSDSVGPLCRVLLSQGLLPPADSRLRQRPVVLPQEEPRLPRQVVAVLGGWAATPPGPTDHVEIYNNVTNSWRTIELKLPAKRAYHGLILRGNQVSQELELDGSFLVKGQCHAISMPANDCIIYSRYC